MSAALAHQDPVWWPGPAPEFPVLVEEADAEVLVVGGGMSGLSLAWTLAEQGVLVALLEAGRIAGGATGRSAGLLLTAPVEPYQEMIALWGHAGARAVLDLWRRGHERVRRIVEALSLDCAYVARGGHRLAGDAEEAEAIRVSLPLLRADGFPLEEVPRSQALPHHAARRFHAAFHAPHDGEIDPVRFLRGLAVRAARQGARLFEATPLLGARWRAGLWEARSRAGVARARVLVLCSNAHAPRLAPALQPLLKPRRGQMLATTPLGETVAPCPACTHRGYRHWRQTADGRLVIGGWRETDRDAEVGYGTEVTESIQRGIESGLRGLMPGGARVERRWAGTMGFVRDGRPLVGWLDEAHHLAICGGFAGRGLGMAAACTLDLAALLQHRDAPAIALCDPSRYPELRTLRAGVTLLGAGAS